MLNQTTLEHLRTLKLDGMARGLEEQRQLPAFQDLGFEDRLGILVDRERHWRDDRRLKRLLKAAKLKHADACLEDVDYSANRGLQKSVIAGLTSNDWIRQGQSILLTGPTGAGKTYIACALGNKACREGLTVRYWRAPRLFQELALAKGDGRHPKLLRDIAKADLLILDDWATALLTDEQRRDLFDIVEDRYERRATLIAAQVPLEHWHQTI
ncbi:MAG: IS21-like element helper ATPase IstB, partial [Xanthomonadales bacterium]|nr:IS21-like element helper ATPase IstB [Xanthomonadales bacterium]